MRKSTNLPTQFYQAAEGSFDDNRSSVKFVIIHTMVGSLDGTKSWFQNPNRASLTSAHYGIGKNKQIHQYVYEDQVAYHAGDYGMNRQSIGIEHEDGGDTQNGYTEELYQTSAMLIADICTHYDIPITREYIRKHNEVSQKYTACPGGLDIDKLVKMAHSIVSKPIGGPNVSDETKTYQMREQDFINMVAEGTNFKTIAQYFNNDLETVPAIISYDPESGKRIINYIKEALTAIKTQREANYQLQLQVNTLNTQIDKLSNAQIPTQPPEVTPENPESPMQNPITGDPTVPDDQNIDIDGDINQKPLLKMTIGEFLRWLFTRKQL